MEQYELLRELRKEKHIKAVTIADKLQISQSYLSEIENGKKKLPLNLLNSEVSSTLSAVNCCKAIPISKILLSISIHA